MQLFVGETGGRSADAGGRLDLLNFHRLALGGGLGAGRKVLTDALAVEPAGEAENDLPGGIREF